MFAGRESEAVFAWSGEHVAGQLHMEGQSWVLEGCGRDCFLWIGYGEDFEDEELDYKSVRGDTGPTEEWRRLRVRWILGGVLERRVVTEFIAGCVCKLVRGVRRNWSEVSEDRQT